MRKLLCVLLLTVATSGYAENSPDPLEAAVSGAQREAKNVARDGYRHPQETLSFFGIRPDLQVLE
ncbi:MAG: hypothetical protein OXC62_00725, partial [Aestuariivita sp.]|nr:hypothetical protein [Aestuariivita sp.]